MFFFNCFFKLSGMITFNLFSFLKLCYRKSMIFCKKPTISWIFCNTGQEGLHLIRVFFSNFLNCQERLRPIQLFKNSIARNRCCCFLFSISYKGFATIIVWKKKQFSDFLQIVPNYRFFFKKNLNCQVTFHWFFSFFKFFFKLSGIIASN